MTSFHLPPPYHQPRCIVQLADRILQASYVKNLTQRNVTSADDGHPLDWSAISGNVIATVLGAVAVAVVGSVFYIAVQVPRTQSEILSNQVEMSKALAALNTRIERLELNDRRQDERIIRQEHK